MKTGAKRNCRECGDVYTVDRRWQVFCGTNCRVKWNRRTRETCFYCGAYGNHRDHVQPFSTESSSLAKYRYFDTIEYVVACKECNCLLSNHVFPNPVQRLEYLIRRFTCKHKLEQGAIKWDFEELEELGPRLRQRIHKFLVVRHAAEERLVYMQYVAEQLRDCGDYST